MEWILLIALKVYAPCKITYNPDEYYKVIPKDLIKKYYFSLRKDK